MYVIYRLGNSLPTTLITESNMTSAVLTRILHLYSCVTNCKSPPYFRHWRMSYWRNSGTPIKDSLHTFRFLIFKICKNNLSNFSLPQDRPVHFVYQVLNMMMPTHFLLIKKNNNDNHFNKKLMKMNGMIHIVGLINFTIQILH